MIRYLLHGHVGGVTGVATPTQGDLLVSVGADRVAKVWAMTSQKLLHPVRWMSLTFPVTAICVSGDSHLLLASRGRIQELRSRPTEGFWWIFFYIFNFRIRDESGDDQSDYGQYCHQQRRYRQGGPQGGYQRRLGLGYYSHREAGAGAGRQTVRQCHFGHQLVADPVVQMTETKYLSVIAMTR